jgi:hypothetical protein
MRGLPIFRRSSGPAIEEWHAGDLAECIVRGPWYMGGLIPRWFGPRFGERYVVVSVGSGHEGALLLGFARFDPHRFAAIGFRKVTSRADEKIAAEKGWLDRLLQKPASPWELIH